MPFNLGPLELLILLVTFGFVAAVAVVVGKNLLRGSRRNEQLEDLQDKVEFLEFQLKERRLEERPADQGAKPVAVSQHPD